MKRIISLGLMGILLITGGLLPGAPAYAADWNMEAIDAPKHPQESAIALDSTNRPHIAYGGDALYYAYYNGASWNYETVDLSPGMGYRVDLGLDGTNKAHIAYYDAISNNVMYATNYSGVWQTAIVGYGGDKNATVSIAVQSLGLCALEIASINDILSW